MLLRTESTVRDLLAHVLGRADSDAVLAAVRVPAALLAETGPDVSRAAFAMALNLVLFHGLLERVPSGAAYVGKSDERMIFDHGALRTIRFVDGSTGALPAGQEAFARILGPLGYRVADVYPLPALKMTGRAWCHVDLPETMPQFFVSELHVERFGGDFQAVATRVFGASRDPLDEAAKALLGQFEAGQSVGFAVAAAQLPVIAGAFDRQHDMPTPGDYEWLLAHSPEAAWIATEGNAFNHVTDRVADVEALAGELRTAGWPIKDKVEISASGRVRQTAFRADVVERAFAGGERRIVPGSFYEFISRAVDPASGALDLRFDSGNATGIFAMTRAA